MEKTIKEQLLMKLFKRPKGYDNLIIDLNGNVALSKLPILEYNKEVNNLITTGKHEEYIKYYHENIKTIAVINENREFEHNKDAIVLNDAYSKLIISLGLYLNKLTPDNFGDILEIVDYIKTNHESL